MIFQVPATLTKVTTMVHHLRLQYDTQETLTNEHKAQLFEWHNQLGWLNFAIHQIEPEDIKDLPRIAPQNELKSPSQRLRAVLFLIWKKTYYEQKEHGETSEKTFEKYYEFQMEKIIDHYKESLNES
jgi:hypothetical protein